MKTLRTPLAQARGLGAAKSGAGHWWMQRVTSAALVPLVLWLAFAVASLGSGDHAAVSAWIQSPTVAVLLILLIAVGCYHMQLGLQVIVEDYVGADWLKIAGVVLVDFFALVLAVIGVLAVLRIAL